MPLHKNMWYKNGRTVFKGILEMIEDSLLSSRLVSLIILFYKTQVGHWHSNLKKSNILTQPRWKMCYFDSHMPKSDMLGAY